MFLMSALELKFKPINALELNLGLFIYYKVWYNWTVAFLNGRCVWCGFY